MYFRRSWGPWLGYCTYQQRSGWRENEKLHLSPRGPFRDSDGLPGWGTDSALNINTESVNSVKQKSLFKVKPEKRSMYGQDSKMEQYSPAGGEPQAFHGTPRSWWNSEEAEQLGDLHRQKSHDWGTWIQVALRLRRNDSRYWFSDGDCRGSWEDRLS